MIQFVLAFLAATSLHAQTAGIEKLMEGNKRYVQDAMQHPRRDTNRREALVASQEPFAIIVGCSDSRVAPEIIFDQGVGDLFVVRVAGNVIGPLELDSIDYSAIYLHSSVILVLGHENCGAVDAVIKGTTKDIESVAKLIEPAVSSERQKKASNLLIASIKQNAINMKEYLLTTPAIKKLISEEKIEVHAGYYNLDTGLVELLNQ